MEASAGLVAGSHNRNELVVIRRDGEQGVRTHSRCQFPRLLAGVVLISGSYCSPSRWTGRTGGRARFAATTWASPPAASPSWRATSAPSQSAATATSTSGARARRAARSARPGSSASRASPPPLPAPRFSVSLFFFLPPGGDSFVAGCARVPGDEEEEGVDDLEDEFNWKDNGHDSQYVAESMLHAHMSYGRAADLDGVFQPIPNVPLLTNGQVVWQNSLIRPPTLHRSAVSSDR
jgi:hypothetical protein